MQVITRQEAKNLIVNSNGTFFSAVFTKKNGERREMVARTGVTKYLSGGILGFNPQSRGYMVVFEPASMGYRMLNLKTLERLKIGGSIYKVR